MRKGRPISFQCVVLMDEKPSPLQAMHHHVGRAEGYAARKAIAGGRGERGGYVYSVMGVG